METTIFKAPVCELKSLDNLFIEMTAKSCNQHCKHCYIDFPIYHKVKDFISVDTVKKTLSDVKNQKIQCIYLTGAEPMTHPDFNSILRLCLKQSNVCICTNGSLINEKKARFLKRVQDEGNFEIIFKLSLDHYNENKNDALRCRGSYRQVISAIKHLRKYGFNPIVTVTNYYQEPEDELMENFKRTFEATGITLEERNLQINKWFNKNDKDCEFEVQKMGKTDCQHGRIVTSKGIYACPFLANDHRGRCGSDFTDFATKVVLETPYCNTCLDNKRQVFSINLSDFSC